MNKKLIVGSIAILLAVSPALVGAQGVPKEPPLVTSVSSIGGIFDLIQTATKWIFGILMVLAVIFLLYSAFLYLTSGGEDEKTKKAKGYLLYAIIAVVIGLVARGLIELVKSFLGPSAE